ncbi:MAG: HAD family hydrolase [Ilumatobacteraceae bacterium]
MRPTRFDALIFDVGGIFLLPDPTVIGPLLAYYGGSPDVASHRRAHYAGMAAKSAAGAIESDWHPYNVAYVRAVGVPEDLHAPAVRELELTRNAYTWRWPIPENVAALRALHDADVPLGVVSNASGQIAELLWRGGVCQEGTGPLTPVRVIVDSHVVGVSKPDPRIFEIALAHFAEFDRRRIAYIGDSVTMDVGGARAAGLHPILLDPHDDHPGADFERLTSLWDLEREPSASSDVSRAGRRDDGR